MSGTSSTPNDVLFKANQFYSHALLHINYTTYDLRHENNSINPHTNHCNILLLAQNDGPEFAAFHPFRYAHVLGIYHANVILTGPESRDYQARHLEFLWVWWFELLELSPVAGFKECSLNNGRFVPTDRTDAFGFVDPLMCSGAVTSYQRLQMVSSTWIALQCLRIVEIQMIGSTTTSTGMCLIIS